MSQITIPAPPAQAPVQRISPGKLLAPFYLIWNDRLSLLIFTLLPVTCYAIFGIRAEWAEIALGRGNVSAQIMLNMAVYGTIFSVSAGATKVGVEAASGWLREVMLSPVTLLSYNLARVITLVFSGLIIAAVLYIFGFATSAEMEPVAIWESFLILILGIVIGALIGLAIGLALKSEEAAGLNGALSSLIAFLSGLFMPLDQMGAFLQNLSPWTPLWGVAQLIDGCVKGWPDPILWPLVNIGVTIVLLGLAIVALARR